MPGVRCSHSALRAPPLLPPASERYARPLPEDDDPGRVDQWACPEMDRTALGCPGSHMDLQRCSTPLALHQ